MICFECGSYFTEGSGWREVCDECMGFTPVASTDSRESVDPFDLELDRWADDGGRV
jgi:hypothetical protein